jgi:hypothetical protein
MDKDRRKFLKIILIGSGTLLAGKVLGPLFSSLLDDSSTKNDSTAFKVSEDEKNLSIYDSSGEEIFQIDKEA